MDRQSSPSLLSAAAVFYGHSRNSTQQNADLEEGRRTARQRVAYELRSRRASPSHARSPTRDASVARSSTTLQDGSSRAQSFAQFWKTRISVAIDEKDFRDHLALERTFLAYLRTSLQLSMTGVLIAQLYRLQHLVNPDPVFGFYKVGLPLSITFIGMAIIVMLIGAARAWRCQSAMLRGKAQAGGWEVLTVMGAGVMLLVVSFALVLGVSIDKAMKT